MIDKIYILKQCQGCYFSGSPGKKSGLLLCVVSNHHKLIIELGEESFRYGQLDFLQFFVDIENFYEICNEVVHMRNYSNQRFCHF